MRYLLPLKSKVSVPNFFPMIDWEDQVALPLAELVRVCKGQSDVIGDTWPEYLLHSQENALGFALVA